MLPHYRFSDDTMAYNAQTFARLMWCANNGHTPPSLVHAYGSATTQLLSISSYDKELYESEYRRNYEAIHSSTAVPYGDYCDEATEKLPNYINNVNEQYRSMMRERMGTLAQMQQQAGTFATSLPTYDQPMGYVPTQPPELEVDKNTHQYYLVNTSNGQVVCSATDAGYVNCY